MTGHRDLRHVARKPSGGTITGMTLFRFVGHYVEMIVGMVVGMLVLGPQWTRLAPGLTDRADLHALVMATDMTIGMAAWMAVRGHPWPRIAEMSAVMYLPFLL